MSISKDQIGGVLLLTFSLIYGALTFNIERPAVMTEVALTARSLPYALTVLGVILASWLILFGRSTVATGWRSLHWRRFLLFIGLMTVYGMTIRPWGFIPATLTFLICGFGFLGERRIRWLFGVAVSVAFGFWLLLSQFLGVYLQPWPNI